MRGIPSALPPMIVFLKEKSALSATSLFIVYFHHFVTGLTGIDGKDTPPGSAETGTVIVGETFGVLLAVSSMTSSAYPEV